MRERKKERKKERTKRELCASELKQPNAAGDGRDGHVLSFNDLLCD